MTPIPDHFTDATHATLPLACSAAGNHKLKSCFTVRQSAILPSDLLPTCLNQGGDNRIKVQTVYND